MQRIVALIIHDRTGVEFDEIIPSARITTNLSID